MFRGLTLDPAGLEIEDFLLVEPAAGAAVAAFHLIRIDLQTGHGVGLAVVAEKQVAALLVGICEMRSVRHPDETCKDRAGIGEQNILIQQVTESVGG